MELALYARMLRHRWGLVVALLLIGLLGAGAYALLTPRSYSASAEAYVSTSSASSVNDLNQGVTFSQQVVVGYGRLATSPLVLDRVITSLDLHMTAQQLAQRISVTTPLDTSTIEIAAAAPSAMQAASISNAVLEGLVEAVPAVSADNSGTAAKITTIMRASASSANPTGSPIKTIAIGGAAGLIIGLLVGLIVELADPRVRRVGDLEEADVAVIGALPRRGRNRGSVLDGTDAATSGSFRLLATRVDFARLGASAPRSVLVTSSTSDESRSAIASGLAIALARAGRRVALVDADAADGAITRDAGLDGASGLSDVIDSLESFDRSMRTHEAARVTILPLGSKPESLAGRISGELVGDLLDRLSLYFDYVVVAGSSLEASVDLVTAGSVSGTLLVATAGHSRRKRVRRSVRELGDVNSRVIGAVLTDAPGGALALDERTRSIATPDAPSGRRRDTSRVTVD